MADGDDVATRPPNKLRQKSQATRHGLITLGLQRFRDKGYSSTTIEDLVRDSEYTRGAFYFHFASKEDFFIELLRARIEARGQWWLVARDPALTTLEEAITATLAQFARIDPGGNGWVMPISDFSQVIQGDPGYVQALREIYAHWIGELSALIDELRERGMVRTDRSPAQLAAAIFATSEGHVVHERLYGADLSGVVDAITRILRP